MTHGEPLGREPARRPGRLWGLHRVGRRQMMRALLPAIGIAILLTVPLGPLASSNPSTETARAIDPLVSVHGGTGVLPSSHGSVPLTPPRGAFYEEEVLPKVAASQQACFQGTCVNATTDPSMNLTSTGLLAVAYTSYSFSSACPYAQSEVAVTTSTDDGQTWSTPTYQDGPNCGAGSSYNSSWEPSLTSLANGTLVLAYIQYNLSASSSYPYPPDFEWGDYQYTVPYDRLVLTESYDGGATWTAPKVLAASADPTLDPSSFSSPLRPYVTATGNTIYVAWTNISAVPYASFSCGAGVSCIQNVGPISASFMASADGGQSWGPVRDLNPENVSPIAINASVNPTITVLPSGQLTIAYIGNITGQSPFCEPSYCQNWGINPGYWGLEGGQIVVARSTNNGTTFHYSLVPLNPSNEPLWIMNPSATPTSSASQQYPRGMALSNPYPSMTYDTSSGQLYIAVEAGNLSEVTGWNEETTVFVTNSSTSGATWTPVRQVDPSLIQAATGGCYYLSGSPGGCASQAEGDASVVVSNGSLVVAFGYYDYQACGMNVAGSTECGMVEELVYNSTDNGYSFTPAGVASTVSTVDDELYAGASASAIGTGSNLWIAWTQPWCPDWMTLECAWPQAGPDGPQVLVSQPYTGTGVSVQFQEAGLPANASWGIDMGGNVVQGTAGQTLALSGVPPATSISWSAVNDGIVDGSAYGVRYLLTSYDPAPPYAFTANRTLVTVTFVRQVLLNIATAPSAPSCGNGPGAGCWDSSTNGNFNYNVTMDTGPFLSSSWQDAGTLVSLSVVPSPGYCPYQGACYEENLSFQSWTGTGPGSINSSTPTVSLNLTQPANETGNFQVVGLCYVDTSDSPNVIYNCGGLNYTLTFDESGLPAGTPWGVTALGVGTGWVQSNSSAAAPSVTITSGAAASGLTSYGAWSVPASGGLMWVPTSSTPTSPIALPGQASVSIQYGIANPSTLSFLTSFVAEGLPAGTSYSLDVDSRTYGSSAAVDAFDLGGGVHTLGPSTVYASNSSGLSNGVAFYLQSAEVIPGVANDSAQVLRSFPASIAVDGPAVVELRFAPMYRLTIEAGAGGTVNASSQWVVPGQRLNLSATTGTNYSFVQWSGSGPGAVTATTTTISIVPLGAVTEIATFRHLPPPTFVAFVNATGLPAGLGASLQIGDRVYGSNASGFAITGLNGTYGLTALEVFANASALSRYIPLTVNITFPKGEGGVSIRSDGWINISYLPQYAVHVIAIGSGTTDPAPGTTWQNRSTLLELSATPSDGARLSEWTGSGPGSVNSSAASISVTVDAPITEIATFVFPPASLLPSYTLSVEETGLPPGTNWSFSLGDIGASGDTSALQIGRLNGSYDLEIPTITTGTTSRFVANRTTETVAMTSNLTVPIAFTAGYRLWVESSIGGNVTPSAPGWVSGGTAVTLTATASGGWLFAGWTGTGPGSITSNRSSIIVTVDGGGMAEAASFVPQSTLVSVTPAGTGTNGLPLDIVLLAGLLVVGLGSMYALGRARRQRADRRAASGALEAPADADDVALSGSAALDAKEPIDSESTGPPS